MNKVIYSLFLFNLFYASLFSQVNHWETVVYGSDDWRYFIGNSAPPTNWNQSNFTDQNWQLGKGPIGYGDGDDATEIPPTFSLFIRHQFEIVDIAAIAMIILQADYDDAFVAYINGKELARANLPVGTIRHNTETLADHEATLYQNGTVESFVFNEVESFLKEGTNTLALSIHNRFGPQSSDMTANFFLTLGISDETTHYRPTPSWFRLPFFESDLPIIKINTDGFINQNFPAQGEMGIVNKDMGKNNFFDTPNEYHGNITIKHRGQSSLSFAKKNFSIELKDEIGEDLDTSFLNFPKEEDFILHGPYSDKSLMRNVLTMHFARSMGQYASRTEYVDLYINEDYQGVYVLMEKIKRDKGRVDVAKLRDIDIEGDELTGGYIFKVDKDEADWFSNYNIYQGNRKLEYQLVYPDIDKVQPEQFAYIQSYVDSFERAMVNPNLTYGGKSFDEFIDLSSFVEAHLLNEIGRNVDGYRLSSYFHKQKNSDGGKIFAGPVWDFNLAYRNADYCDGADTEGLIFYRLCDGNYPFWWDKLIQNEQFQNLRKCRWEELRSGSLHTDSIFDFIDEQVAKMGNSTTENFRKWAVLGVYLWPNPTPLAQSYPQEIMLLKNWLANRLNWLGANLPGDCDELVSIQEALSETTLTIFPNPASGFLEIKWVGIPVAKIENISIISSLGQRLEVSKIDDFTLDIQSFLPGIYFLEIEGADFKTVKQFSVIR